MCVNRGARYDLTLVLPLMLSKGWEKIKKIDFILQ